MQTKVNVAGPTVFLPARGASALSPYMGPKLAGLAIPHPAEALLEQYGIGSSGYLVPIGISTPHPLIPVH